MNKYKKFLFLSVFVLFLIFIITGTVYGANNSEELNLETSEQGELELSQPLKEGGLLARYILSVLGILILTYWSVKFFVRRTSPSTQYGDWIQVIDYMPLGANRGFYLVEIEGKGFILGITEQQINILSTIEDQERLDELRGLSLKKKYPSKIRLNIGINKNSDFHQSLQKHINQTQELYSKHKRGDRTYEE